ncbi:unnamed protein product [Periconia digitata]|uniref:Uncharacterized protein n=1 Tax=Periconia digitata TaxID=1303443 RepID=A0A9W4U3I4_9PLEO|nr:unnamed protein product [Periconia digitata]
MCFTEDGIFTWIKNRKTRSSEEPEIRQRSASARSGTATPQDDRSRQVHTPVSIEEIPRLKKLRTVHSFDSTSAISPKTGFRDDSAVGMSSGPSSPVDGFPTYHTAISAQRVSNPRMTVGPRSSSLPVPTWSLFPTPPNYSRPVTAASQLTRMASSRDESNPSFRNCSPTRVQVRANQSYARSEMASIHQRTTRHFSYQSDISEAPPSPPPKLEDIPTPYAQNSRPVSFRTFVAQSQGRSQSHNSSCSNLSPHTATGTRSSMQNRASRSAGPPPVNKVRGSRRTSLKSFLGRNGYSDEGIFVATSDDPDAPFTMFRWPNPGSGQSTPRSSTMIY